MKGRLQRAGFTLTEMIVAMAISSMLCAGLITSAISLQKSFVASRYHVMAQAQQMLLLDYMNLDLRRALTVTTTATRLVVTIPDYYDADGTPRDPQIRNGTAVYGPSPKTIAYYQSGSSIYRQEGATSTALATDVADFQFAFLDLGQSIQVGITFVPRYQFTSLNRGNVRDGTAAYVTTLLRNKRQN